MPFLCIRHCSNSWPARVYLSLPIVLPVDRLALILVKCLPEESWRSCPDSYFGLGMGLSLSWGTTSLSNNWRKSGERGYSKAAALARERAVPLRHLLLHTSDPLCRGWHHFPCKLLLTTSNQGSLVLGWQKGVGMEVWGLKKKASVLFWYYAKRKNHFWGWGKWG